MCPESCANNTFSMNNLNGHTIFRGTDEVNIVVLVRQRTDLSASECSRV